jgi:TrmH family RNA methyltransferase
MAIRIVQSKQNARVKELRAALLRPARSSSALVALEGIHLLLEASRSGIQLVTVFIEIGHEALLEELEISPSVEVLALPREVLISAVSTESPQPIAALARPGAWNWDDLLEPNALKQKGLSRKHLLVVLAGVQDPGNLGTILRSAEAFGADAAISLPGTVSHWNPKAVRASAGSIFRLPVIASSETECIQHLRDAGVQIMAAMAHEALPLDEHNLRGSIALVIGAEGSGISPELAGQCDARVTIPCPGPVESLNAAVAASVLLYETARQRALPALPKGKRR